MEPNITSLFIIDLSASASSSRRRRAERSGVQFPPNYPPKDTKPLDTKDTKTFSTQETSRNLLQKPFGSKDTKTFSKQRFWRETLSSRNRKPRPAKSMDNGRRRHRRTKTIPSNFVNDVIPSRIYFQSYYSGVFSCGWFLGGEPPYLRASTSRAKQRTTLDNT